MPQPNIPLNREALQSRIAFIEESLQSLERFQGISFEDFQANPDNYRIAFFDLHRCLEAVMDIGSHLLSRIPGARPTSYKDIPRLLEKYKIITPEYAKNRLIRMAGYRNRMVHFYGEITEKEIHKIIQEELRDFYTFLVFVGKVLKEPSKYHFTVSQQ